MKYDYLIKEYPSKWSIGEEAYYPVNDEQNRAKYRNYTELADAETGVIFGGKLGAYQYLDMDKTIHEELSLCEGGII